jgi:hypothetical protein
MNDRENNACQHVLNCIETLKYTPVVQMIQAWVRLFPMNLETYSLAYSFLVSNPCTSIAMMWVHLMGEELKKQKPNLVAEIEQERVKYLTIIHGQLHNMYSQFFNQFNV